MTLATIHAVTMPKWGIEMTEGTLTEWIARVGQQVNKGDPLLEVETDKIVNTVEAPASGVLRQIMASVGEVKAVGTLIAVLADESASDADVVTFITGFRGASVSFEPASQSGEVAASQDGEVAASQDGEVAASQDGEVAASQDGGPAEDSQTHVSPIARRLARQLGIDVSQLRGTGRNGRVSKEDVEAFAARKATVGSAIAGTTNDSAPGSASVGSSAANPGSRVKLSATRATIARRLSESKQTIPHYRVQIDVDVVKLQTRRKELAREASSGKISLNDMLIHCTALALTQHRALNAHLVGDEVIQYARADIPIAVATDGGLITPIVRSADLLSPLQIAQITADLSERARQATLTREDIAAGTFSISNLGMHGLTSFDAIINPPQVAILAVGAAQDRVIARDGAPFVTQMLTLTLSADHRVVDGAVSAAFLAALRDIVQA